MEHKKLGDIATYVNGYAFKPEDRGTEGLPIIRIQDLTGNSYDLGFYNGEYPKKIELNNGDILISWSASLGVYEWNRGKALLNQHIFKVVFDKLDVSKKYFVFAVKYNLKEMEKRTHGATMKHITKKDFDNVLVPFPPLNKQQEIADTLDTLQSVITHRKQQLEKLDLLVKFRFVEMFGEPTINDKSFPIKKLSDIAEYWNGLTYKPENISENGIIVLRSSNIQNYQLDFKDTIRVDCKIGNKKIVQKNDILMCSRNGSAKLVGKVALIDKLSEPMSFGAFMMIIRSKYYNYLMTYFQLPAFRTQITTGATTTINQITGKMLDKINIPVPPLDLQTQFADFVKQVDKSRFAIQNNLEQAQMLFDSLMQEYFG